LHQEEEKLEIEYRPLKKLVILESLEMPQKELLEKLVAQIKYLGSLLPYIGQKESFF